MGTVTVWILALAFALIAVGALVRAGFSVAAVLRERRRADAD